MSLDVFAVMIKCDNTYVKSFAGCFNKRLKPPGGGSEGKESACNTGGPGSIPGWERSPTPVFLPEESPWTEQPGGPQSMESQRAGHD